MYKTIFNNKFPRKSFFIAILLHVLFLLFFATLIVRQAEVTPKSPQLQNIPSYLYTGALQPTAATQQQTHAEATRATTENETPTPDHAIHTGPRLKKISAQKMWGYDGSIMTMSRQILRQNQISRALNRTKDPDPILLVGDPNTEANPLIKMMAKALSAQFRYPKYEGHLGIRGKVIVQLTFHPEGYFSEPQILQSSDNEDFDAAALYAVNKAPRVAGADRYLSAPKSYVVGFLFD